MSAAGPVRIIIYDALGQAVKILVDATKPPGTHRVDGQGTDNAGKKVNTGVYRVTCTSDSEEIAVKAVKL